MTPAPQRPNPRRPTSNQTVQNGAGRNGAGSAAPGVIPERVFAALTVLPTALVGYFATRILYSAPGNVLALICLALAGLVLGGFVRRYGLRSAVTASALVAVLSAVLLAVARH